LTSKEKQVSIPSPSPERGDPRYTKQGALHLPSGQGVTKWASGDIYTVKAAGPETLGGFGLIEATVPPGGGPVAHVHNDSEEAFYVLSGELEFLDGDRIFTAGTGDFVLVPRGIRHRFKNVALHPARMLFLFTPAGAEQVFIEGGDEPVHGQLPTPWDEARFAKIQEVTKRLKLDTDLLPEDV
jgi:quercetin dioxygenase-like cupin family protein